MLYVICAYHTCVYIYIYTHTYIYTYVILQPDDVGGEDDVEAAPGPLAEELRGPQPVELGDLQKCTK